MNRVAICAVLSVVAHVAIARALETLPPQEPAPPPRKIAIRVVDAPKLEPPPEPEKPPEPKPEPKPEVHDVPLTKPVHAPTVAPVAHDAPPVDHAVVTTDTTDTPTYGITMESTSSAGGPVMPVGNATRVAPGTGSATPTIKPLAAPIAAFEATKLPLPQGRCFGKYTDEAKAAGIEGTVVLDLIVGDDGKVREVVVVQGLAHGLTEAATAAARACRFSPGERDGKPVAVRIRGFKITYVLEEAN